jgi:hypothetical protein
MRCTDQHTRMGRTRWEASASDAGYGVGSGAAGDERTGTEWVGRSGIDISPSQTGEPVRSTLVQISRYTCH